MSPLDSLGMVQYEDCGETPQAEVGHYDPLAPSTALPLSDIPAEVILITLKPPSPLLMSSSNCPILMQKKTVAGSILLVTRCKTCVLT